MFLHLSVYLLSTQEQSSATTENSETVYVIREMEFDIDGRTRPSALIYNGEFTEGERIPGKENLDRYIALKRQLLINKQVLEDVSIEYSLGENEGDGAMPVKLFVHTKDSWNFIVLPYPKYDSNEGFSLTIKAKDFNFLGTMNTLSVDLGYLEKDGDPTIAFSVESETPFRTAGHDWVFTFDNFFEYTFNRPLYYKNTTGLSVELPWQLTAFTVGLNQHLIVNEWNDDENMEIYDLDDRFSGPYASTEPYVDWKIPFGIEVGDFGEISYTPGVSAKINYPFGSIDEPRKPVGTISQTLGFGRTDWIGSYRKGLSINFTNDYSWYFNRSDAPMRVTLGAEGLFYWFFSKYIGFSTRLKYQRWWQWSDILDDWIPYYSAGEFTRGVLDNDIRAYYLFSINLDFPVRILRFYPSELFSKPKLHLFDFEMHFSPFIDTVFFSGPYNKIKYSDDPMEGKTAFGLNDMLNTAGLEIILFPGIFRSLKIRGSIGYNINKIRNEGLSLNWGFFPAWDEIYIGLDHFY